MTLNRKRDPESGIDVSSVFDGPSSAVSDAKPWCYDRLLDSVRKDWDEHDKTCESMAWFWLGRSGGVSCPSDITSCSQCRAMFCNEGVTCVNPDDAEAEEWDYRCECCRRPQRRAD